MSKIKTLNILLFDQNQKSKIKNIRDDCRVRTCAGMPKGYGYVRWKLEGPTTLSNPSP